MYHTPIDELIQTCLDKIKQLGFKKRTINRHQRLLFLIRDYMRSEELQLYDENVGEKYQIDLLTEGITNEFRLKEIRHSVNLLNDILNRIPVRKKRIRPKNYPFPGEIGSQIQDFLKQFNIECRPTKSTQNMYMTALSHFATRLHEDGIRQDNLDDIAVNGFVSSLQNAKLYVCLPVRRFLHYLFEIKLTKKDYSIPLFGAKDYRAEKLPSVYTTEEIRKMDASVEKSSPAGKRNYAIFLLASRLGIRASDIRLLQFHDLDWDHNIIHIIQCKTNQKIELPLLNIIGEAIIDYIRNGRPKSESKTIFLTAIPPFTPISIPGISNIVSRIINKAGIDTKSRHHGSHCLRHSLATRLLEQGTTLPVISEALGHSNTQSTMIYLNVDVNGLLRCSLDVPSVSDSFYMQKGGWFYV